VILSAPHVTPAQETLWYAIYAAVLWAIVITAVSLHRRFTSPIAARPARTPQRPPDENWPAPATRTGWLPRPGLHHTAWCGSMPRLPPARPTRADGHQALTHLIGLETPADRHPKENCHASHTRYPSKASRHHPGRAGRRRPRHRRDPSRCGPGLPDLAGHPAPPGRSGRPALALAHRPPSSPAPHRTLTDLTAIWGIGLLAAAAVQGAGALTGGLTFTSPASFAARALIALAAEAILAALILTWLHRNPAPGPQAPQHNS
jgi:hypothetical protein